jgi:hypothetical protein
VAETVQRYLDVSAQGEPFAGSQGHHRGHDLGRGDSGVSVDAKVGASGPGLLSLAALSRRLAAVRAARDGNRPAPTTAAALTSTAARGGGFVKPRAAAWA